MANLKSFSALQLLLEIGGVDVVLTELYDCELDIIAGVEFIKKNRHHWNNIRLIVLTSIEEPGLIKYLATLGTKVVIYKRNSVANIAATFEREVSEQKRINTRPDEQPNKSLPARGALTMAELNVAWLLARNHTVITISRHMNVSYKTVHTHKKNLMKKLNIADLPQLMKYLSIQHQSF